MAEFPSSGDRLVTVFGGSGFVGRHIVRAFARRGWRVRAAVRRPDLAGFLQPIGNVGQVSAVQANLRYPASLAAAVEGADIVINAAGVKTQSGRQSYEAVHVFGSEEAARAARAAGAGAYIQISGIGADVNSPNRYIASKGRAEDAVRAAFPGAVILQPSVVFGPEDDFLNRFADLSRFFPVLPMFGGGGVRLQPVYVGDIALAAAKAIDGGLASGQTYELGGPETLTLQDIMKRVLVIVERRRGLAPLPLGLSRMIAGMTELASAVTLGKFPRTLTTTRDQIDLLADDIVVSEAAQTAGRTLAGLGLDAQGIDAIAPSYLLRYRRSGQFAPSRFA